MVGFAEVVAVSPRVEGDHEGGGVGIIVADLWIGSEMDMVISAEGVPGMA